MSLEVCIDSIESGIAAEAGGASRIELCSALSEGGLTPSVGLLVKIKSVLKIPVFVMIRPRCGDFLYSQHEIDIMIKDIELLKAHGADGFVFGVLNKSAQIDLVKNQALVDACRSSTSVNNVTFHRAFDQTANPLEALEAIIGLGFTRILTSGQQPTAKAGISLIKKLVTQADGRIIIMPGTGISSDNVAEIVSETGVKEFHASARKMRRSEMEIPNHLKNVTMGSQADDFVTLITDENIVRAIVANASIHNS